MPQIPESLHTKLYSFMGGVLKTMDCKPILINGTNNHIHILCILSRKYSLSKVVEEVKKSSSRWIKTQDQHAQKFYWQDGYSAFSVSQSQLDRVKKYITNQKQHHQRKSYKEEVIGFLKAHGVEYNEEYLWRS